MPKKIKSDAELLAECEALDAAYAGAAEFDARLYESSLCKAPIEGGLCAQPKGHEADNINHSLLIDSEYLDGEWPVTMGWVGKDGRP